MASVINYLKIILVVQLFYAFAITGIVYSIPANQQTNLAMYRSPADEFSQKYITDQVQGNMQKQVTLPVIELATLVYYSGNVVLDLLLNFATAVPQMFTLLISSFLFFFNVDPVLAYQIQSFFIVLIGMLYLISIVTFLLNIRSTGGAVV